MLFANISFGLPSSSPTVIGLPYPEPIPRHFFFIDTAPTEIYTLSLHDALPILANKYAFLQITRRRFLNEWEAFKKVISRRNIRRRITIPLTLSNLKLLRRITRTENILHRNFTRRQVAIQNRVASNI